MLTLGGIQIKRWTRKGTAIGISSGTHQVNAVKCNVYNHFPYGKERVLTLFEQTFAAFTACEDQVCTLKCLLCCLLYKRAGLQYIQNAKELIRNRFNIKHFQSFSAPCVLVTSHGQNINVRVEHKKQSSWNIRQGVLDGYCKEKRRLSKNPHQRSLVLTPPPKPATVHLHSHDTAAPGLVLAEGGGKELCLAGQV